MKGWLRTIYHWWVIGNWRLAKQQVKVIDLAKEIGIRRA